MTERLADSFIHVDTIATHPATKTHSALPIFIVLGRLSISPFYQSLFFDPTSFPGPLPVFPLFPIFQFIASTGCTVYHSYRFPAVATHHLYRFYHFPNLTMFVRITVLSCYLTYRIRAPTGFPILPVLPAHRVSRNSGRYPISRIIPHSAAFLRPARIRVISPGWPTQRVPRSADTPN